ncbi:MAG: VWA domain-containing protein [Vulcanimicrobiota bacterium]
MKTRLTGSLAAVEVRQAFVNPYPVALEFCYLFPLRGSLSRFRIQAGGRLLESQAGAGTEMTDNHRPSLLGSLFEGEMAPVFSAGIGLLEPGESVAIELFYGELLAQMEFHFPLTISPKLGQAESCPIQMQILLEGPVNRLVCNLPGQSQTLANGDVRLDLTARLGQPDLTVCQPDRGEHPQAILRQSAQHFCLDLVPPAATPPTERDLVILVDASDNCTPTRFALAQQLVRQLLLSLNEGEQFALVTFQHDIEGFEQGDFRQRSRLDEACAWLAGRRPGGRADLSRLLERVLKLPRQRERTVILIASGPVGNEPELYAMVCASAEPPPFLGVGLGPQVNWSFLRRLAAMTRGGYSGRIWLREPALIDLGLGGHPASVTPTPLPHLSQKSTTLLGRKSGNGTLQVSAARPDGRPWSQIAASYPCQNPALGLLWAAQKVQEMLDESKLTVGPKALQLRQLCEGLCREYALHTEISPLAVGGRRLADLNPASWNWPEPASRPKARPLPVAPPAIVKEAPRLRAGLGGPKVGSPGVKAMRSKVTKDRKYEAKPRQLKPVLKRESPLARARRLLERERDLWREQLRLLYKTRQPDQLLRVLQRLRPLQSQSTILAEVYRIGGACYHALRIGHPQAEDRTRRWVESFATLLK